MLVQLIAIVATILAAVFLVPQILRLLRYRERAGISVTWAALGLVTNIAWIAYLAPLGLWSAAAAPGLAVVAYALVLRLVAPGSGSVWWAAAGLHGAALTGIGWVLGPSAVGLALAATPGVHLAPQLFTVTRELRPLGVSRWSWGIGTGEAALWAIYGTMVGDPALIGYGLVTGIGSGLVLLCCLARPTS